MATLAEKQAELVVAKDALNAARFAVGYSQGDRSLQRARVAELEQHVARIAREIRELTAYSQGADNPMVVTASWT